MTRITIFASGSGSNALRLIQHFERSDVADVALVCTNNAGAGVVDRSRSEEVPVEVFSLEQLNDGTVLRMLRRNNIDLIVLAGFMRKIPDELLQAFPDRILNIHPSLLPKYGGKGMYGHHVHEAVLTNGETESGISIHLVDQEYDKGRMLFQISCPVEKNDDAASLQQRVQRLEHEYLPKVVERYIVETMRNV